MSSHALFGGNLHPTAAPTLKSQLQTVLPTYQRPAVDIIVESPCATAAGKRINSEAESVTGNSNSEHSGTDAFTKEHGSDVGEDSKTLMKVETLLQDSVEAGGNVGPSPSKTGKSKL